MNIFLGKNSKLLKLIYQKFDLPIKVLSLQELYDTNEIVESIVLFKNIHDNPDKNFEMLSSIARNFPNSKILIFQSFITFFKTDNLALDDINCGFEYKRVDNYSDSKFICETAINEFDNIQSIYISSIDLDKRYKIFLPCYFKTEINNLVQCITLFLDKKLINKRTLCYHKIKNRQYLFSLPIIRNNLMIKLINRVTKFNFFYYRVFIQQCKNTSL